MGTLIFVLGGAQSGKSRFALSLAKNGKGRAAFIATCLPSDMEMNEKISRHKKERPKNWVTVEAGLTPFHMTSPKSKIDSVLIDSLTLWVARCLEKGWGREEIEKKAKKFLVSIKKKFNHIVIVSDEVGLSIVPGVRSARNFRVCLGEINQLFAKNSDCFYMVFAGVPVCVKGENYE